MVAPLCGTALDQGAAVNLHRIFGCKNKRSSMTQLQRLYLYSNSLTGTLPPSWSSMSQLQSLYLFINMLTGPLPPMWGNMTQLQQLFLFNNHLSGPFPPSWGDMVRLVFCVLCFSGDHNRFRPLIPSRWGGVLRIAATECTVPPTTRSHSASLTRITRTASIVPYGVFEVLQRVSPAVSAVVIAATVPATLAAVASAGTLQRLMLSMFLLSCDGALGTSQYASDSPTRLSVGDDALRYVRGAVVGNVLVWSVASVLVVGVAVGVAAVKRQSVRYTAGSLRLPAGLVVVFLPLLQPTVSCVVELLRHGDDAVSIAIGAAGAVVVFAISASFGWSVTANFAALAHCGTEKSIAGGSYFTRAVGWVASPFCTWTDSVPGSRFVEGYGLLFCNFTAGRHWYIVVELAIGAVCGVIGGTVPANSSGSANCLPQRVALVVVAIVEFLLLLLLRPSNTRLGTAAMLTNCAAFFASAILVLANQRAAGTVAVVGVAVVVATSATTLAAQFALGRTLPLRIDTTPSHDVWKEPPLGRESITRTLLQRPPRGPRRQRAALALLVSFACEAPAA